MFFILVILGICIVFGVQASIMVLRDEYLPSKYRRYAIAYLVVLAVSIVVAAIINIETIGVVIGIGIIVLVNIGIMHLQSWMNDQWDK